MSLSRNNRTIDAVAELSAAVLCVVCSIPAFSQKKNSKTYKVILRVGQCLKKMLHLEIEDEISRYSIVLEVQGKIYRGL